jgi:membrane-associated phospholipid phosphatase
MTAAEPPLPLVVPGPLRRPMALLVVVAVVVFTVLALRYAGTSSAGAVDMRVDAVVDPLGAAHRWLVHRAVSLGSPLSVVALAFALSAVCLLLGRRRLAVLAVVGPGLTGVCTTLLKPALGRTIEGGFAFPSGHTGGATSLGLVLALLAISLLRPGRGGGLAILAAGALVVGGGVGAAMVASNAHYPTDTVGGFCTAVVAVCGAALVLDRMVEHRAPSAQAP